MSTKFETRVVHAGSPEPLIQGAAQIPIFQSSVFEHDGQGDYDDMRYPRMNNLPNQVYLGRALADLEGGEAGLVTASGMSAISTTLLTLLAGGGHLLAQDCLYGGTHTFVTADLPRLGSPVDLIDARSPESWRGRLRPETRAVYVEAMTNPLVDVIDHEAVVSFAREHGLTSVIDATFATPVNFRPLELGYDVCVHSCSKYLNGHSDLVAGAVVTSRERMKAIVHQANHLGGSLDPHACFLLHRGLKTLVLRVRQQNENALTLARFLSERPEVRRVNHPGLEDHPDHAIAKKLFSGCGGLLSFEMEGDAARADALLSRLTIPIIAPSLGGVETLATRPALTSHRGLTPEERARAGVRDELVRVSVGIEAVDDLVADFAQAFDGGR